MPRRKLNRNADANFEDTSKSPTSQLRELDEFQHDPVRVQQQLLDDETRALQVLRLLALSDNILSKSFYTGFLSFSISRFEVLKKLKLLAAAHYAGRVD